MMGSGKQWQLALECRATDRIMVSIGGCQLAEANLQEDETLENALRRFKRKVLQEDIIREVKRHAFYLKPGQKLRVKQALARKRNRKKARREAEERRSVWAPAVTSNRAGA